MNGPIRDLWPESFDSEVKLGWIEEENPKSTTEQWEEEEYQRKQFPERVLMVDFGVKVDDQLA